MKKSFLVTLLVLVLVLALTSTVWADSTIIKADLLSADYPYVAEAHLIVSVDGTFAQTSETETWTLFEFWFTSGCFRDGQRTISVTSLSAKEGFQWTRDGNKYCIVRE